MIIFGAGVIGEATLHACRAKGISVDCFVDHRIVGPLIGTPVHTLATLPYKSDLYLTSPNIADMIAPAEEMGYGWKSCGEVLRDFDISGIEFQSINGSNQSSRYTTEHVKYLIRTCLHHHENYLRPERLTVPSIDLIVTEACSMRCRDCSNLAQYYEKPENSDINEMFETIDSICSKMDEVYEFRVIGGEPLVNKEVHLVVEKLTSKANVQKVSIFTNATILPREHQWNALGHSKVRFFITEYVQSRKHKELIAELKKRNIPFATETANGWTECAALNVHNRTDEANAAIFTACCAKNLATLHDGALFRCPFSAHATKLQAVPDYPDDSLSVATATREQIRAFLRDKLFIKACDHCNGRSYSAPVIEAAVQTKVPLKYVKYDRKAPSA
ncbi:hypothetical protein A2198_00010 [Candidatus Peribacteria bacterium RIFOXYA1_FULL_56_14]|nr:MAG: hypothetical protein A2198_00010 [Candidatus Peribacteria bacterium RIFOXYA1_FULL_56_14]